MTITERTLKKWRIRALKYQKYATPENIKHVSPEIHTQDIRELSTYILRMTQILLDQHLLRKK